MPCSDVTEYLQVTLNAEDQLLGYNLQKNTCGAPVGNELLLEYLHGMSVDALLTTTLTEVVPELDDAKRIDQFLLTKQFFALQSALRVYVGQDGGTLTDLFVVEKIDIGAEQVEISGLVKVDLIAEQIKACNNCKCSVKKN